MTTTLLSPQRNQNAVFSFARSGAHEVRFIDERAKTQTRPIRIGLLGCGTVGACLAETLQRERARLAADTGIDFTLAKILVRDAGAPRLLPRHIFTTRFDDVLAARPDVIVELLGGLEPATSHIRQALEAGISVVTANKTVIAHHGPSLAKLARRRGARLHFEAAVCAAVPILSVLEQLRGDRIRSIHGILNGSTNYLLSRMSTQMLSLQEALVEAKSLGLVEPDPAADLSGRDAAEKLAILARQAGFDGIDYGSIDIAGIERVTPEDVLAARRAGFAIKLVATLEQEVQDRRNAVSLRVGPTLVPRGHRLASVDRARNAVVIDAELGGELAIEGAGAGPRPTSSAIIGDLVRIARLIRGGGIAASDVENPDTVEDQHPASPLGEHHAATIRPSALQRHYVRLRLGPAIQSPSDILEVFRREGVEIRSIDLREGTARLWTFDASIESIRAAVKRASASEDALIAPVLM